MKQNERLLKIDAESHAKIKSWARKLSVLEDKTISMKEVEKRIISAPDIPERLKIGSIQRRKMLNE